MFARHAHDNINVLARHEICKCLSLNVGRQYRVIRSELAIQRQHACQVLLFSQANNRLHSAAAYRPGCATPASSLVPDGAAAPVIATLSVAEGNQDFPRQCCDLYWG